MDDNDFDDLLKGKLKDYEDPTYDPSALDGLHERLSSFQPTPWYASNSLRSAFISSLFLLTAINTYFFIYNSGIQQNTINKQHEIKLTNSNALDSLKAVINQLQCTVAEQKLENSTPATLATPNFRLHLLNQNESNPLSGIDVGYKVKLGSRENISSEVYNKLKEEDLLTEEHGEVFLLLPKKTNATAQPPFHTHLSGLLVAAPQPLQLQLIALSSTQSENKKLIHPIPEGKTSLAARNALERHYFNRLGLRVAPHLDLVKGIFSQGSGAITPRVGLTADWLVAPRFSIESSLDYTTTENQLTKNEIPEYAQYNPQLGICEKAIYSNRLVSVPLNVKYRQWISDRSQLILRAGYTPYFLLAKQFQYNYVRPDINGLTDDRTTTLNSYRDFKFYGSTMSTSVGLMVKRDKYKGLWEASIFYERSTGKGFDQKNIQLVGLRTAYWFTVK